MKKPNYLRNRRLRMFAGPNGSGKTTILDEIKSRFDIGFYVNADEIEKQLKSENLIDLELFGITDYDQLKFEKFSKNHPLHSKAKSEGYSIDVRVENNRIINPGKNTHSYEASLISDMIRNELLKNGKKMTFETVMSHKSKVDFLAYAQQEGYKNYLYFVSTESPIINKLRVKQRIKLGGHAVNEKKIEDRYYRSLSLLKDAISKTYRTFVFDNSGKEPNLILEIYKGEEVTFKYTEIPKWVEKYILT